MVKKIERLIIVCVFAAVSFCGGCQIIGLVGQPSQYEKNIPAEYDLTMQKGKKILVLVEQPAGVGTKTNLRYYLTESVRESLMSKVKIKPQYVISYKELSEFRSNRNDFSSLLPEEVGKALGADIVLLVTIRSFELDEVVGSGYYNGTLGAKAAVYEVGVGKMWESRSIEIGFDTGERGQEEAIERLVNSCAYCITRYLYNCPKYKFRIFDEGKQTGWGD